LNLEVLLACLPNREARDLHEFRKVAPGVHQRRDNEIRPGVPEERSGLIGERRRPPPPDEDPDLRQRSADPFDQIARLRRSTGGKIREAQN